jgi:hypothetical protein
MDLWLVKVLHQVHVQSKLFKLLSQTLLLLDK